MSPDLKLSQPNIAMNNWLCKHYGGVYLVYVHKKSATSCQNNVIYIHVTVSTNNKIRRYRLSSWEVYRWSWIIMKHRYQHILHINSNFIFCIYERYRILKYYKLQNKSSLKKCAMLVLYILHITAFICYLSYASLSKSNGCAHRYLDDSFRNLLLT